MLIYVVKDYINNKEIIRINWTPTLETFIINLGASSTKKLKKINLFFLYNLWILEWKIKI